MLCGCGTWSLTLIEEFRLKISVLSFVPESGTLLMLYGGYSRPMLELKAKV